MLTEEKRKLLHSFVNDGLPVYVKIWTIPFYSNVSINPPPSPENHIWMELTVKAELRTSEGRFFVCPEGGIIDFPETAVGNVTPSRNIYLKQVEIKENEGC